MSLSDEARMSLLKYFKPFQVIAKSPAHQKIIYPTLQGVYPKLSKGTQCGREWW